MLFFFRLGSKDGPWKEVWSEVESGMIKEWFVMATSSDTCMDALGLVWVYGMLPCFPFYFFKKYIFASCSSLFQGSAAMRLLTHPVVWWACLFYICHLIPFSWPSTTCSLATMAGHVLRRGEGQVANPVVKILASEGTTVTKKSANNRSKCQPSHS